MKHVVIVGAGISGLATAYQLRRLARDRGVELGITVLESGARPGGRVWTERVDGFQIEAGANGFLDSKRSTLELCEETGLGPELIAARPEARNRYLYWRGRLQRLPTGPGGLLASGLLSIPGKLRLLSEPLVRRSRNRCDESVHEFARRRVGREAAEVLVDALVTGIHAGDPALISAPAAFPRMVELEREHGSLFRAISRARREHAGDAAARGEPARSAGRGPGGTLWSLRGGMGRLIERLAETGGELTAGVTVRRALPHAGGWLVEAEGSDGWQADVVVLACPSFAQAEITDALDPELARLLAAIPYTPVAVLALGFRRTDLQRPLDGFGYLSPQRLRRDVLGVLWSSSIFDHRAPEGMALVQAMCGGWNRRDILGWDDERLVRAVLGELGHTLGVAATPVLVRIIRWPEAIPQYHLGHLERVGQIEARRRHYPGLYLTGNSFRGVAINDCTEEAVRCAREVLEGLAALGKGVRSYEGRAPGGWSSRDQSPNSFAG